MIKTNIIKCRKKYFHLHSIFIDVMNNTDKGFCRLCAACKPNNRLVDLKIKADRIERIVTELSLLNCQVDFGDNMMPKTVCEACLKSLTQAFDFINAVKQAQVALEEILSQTIKKEDSDSESFVYEFMVEKCEDIDNIKSESEPVDTSFKPQKVQEEIKNEISDIDSIPLSQLKLTWKDYSWTCAYCETQFPSISELNSHSLEYHKACNAYRCTDCNIRKLKLDRFLTHVRCHRKYLQMSCYKCFKTFPSRYEANKHRASHITSDFKCNGCNECFSSSKELKIHSNKFFRNSRSHHIPVVKTQVQTDGLTCLECKKVFKTKTTLNTHLLIHTDRQYNHICEFCGKRFLQKASLIEHMTLHDDNRPFTCEICQTAFKAKRHLQTHVGVHDGKKPYACEKCGRCFRLQSQLKSHSIIHTDSLPHVCSYCNKQFRFKTILNQHLRQHTGVKPYSCNICKRDFTNWPNYNKHMKRRHNMDMAKKKHTPEGLYPIDPVTNQVICPDMDKMLQWKSKIQVQRKRGRPKIMEKAVFYSEPKIEIDESKPRD